MLFYYCKFLVCKWKHFRDIGIWKFKKNGKTVRKQFSIGIFSLSLLNTTLILLVFIDEVNILNINEKKNMKLKTYIVGTINLQMLCFVAFCNLRNRQLQQFPIIWNCKIVMLYIPNLHFTCSINLNRFNLFGSKNIYIVCFWQWLRKHILILKNAKNKEGLYSMLIFMAEEKDRLLCVENKTFYSEIVVLSHFSFLPRNYWSIRIWQAFSYRHVIMFKNIFWILGSFCPLRSIDT